MHVRYQGPHPITVSSVCLLVASACVSASQGSYDALARDYRAVDERLHEASGDDARILGADTLDREALIGAVLRRNSSLESGRDAWRAALARYRESGTYDDPVVRVAVAPLSIAASDTHFGYEVAIAQRLPLGGKLDAQAAIAANEAQVVAKSYQEMRLKLAVAASQLYDDYFVAVRSLEIQAQHLALVSSLKQSAFTAYESGKTNIQDSLQADAELARVEYQQTVYATQRDVAIAQLNALLHRAPDAALARPNADTLLRDDEAPEADATESKAIDSRPDLASAKARLQTTHARIDAANSEYYPDLMLSTSYNSMWDMPQHRWMVGVELSVPLARERRLAAADEAAALRAGAEHDLDATIDAARAQAVVSLRQVAQARTALQLYEQRLLPIARARIDAARTGFIASQGTFAEVIDAERSLRTIELEQVIVRADLSKRHAELDAARGQLPNFRASGETP